MKRYWRQRRITLHSALHQYVNDMVELDVDPRIETPRPQ
jgi:hypothetical protein